MEAGRGAEGKEIGPSTANESLAMHQLTAANGRFGSKGEILAVSK
jgi:hypothetical protein